MTTPPPVLCRDCFRSGQARNHRCPACGSPRLLTHPEWPSLTIAHIDCDAFFAAVEKRDRPELRDRAVIIGGGRRGVVATACYIARMQGVHSAMPMFEARKRCPDAVIIAPDMEKYARVGDEIRNRMLTLTPLVEPLSIDEAFLDLTGTERLHHGSPAETLARFAASIEREVGISVSVGLSHNKFMAKTASDLDKPRGFTIIGLAETRAFLAARPVESIHGVGRSTAERLHGDGYRLIQDLQAAAPADLARRYGELGLRLSRLAHGEDRRRVSPDSPRKSISAETTFEDSIADPAELRRHLRALSEKVSARLKKTDLAGHTVTLKLKTARFRQLTRARHLSDPTRLADRIFRTGCALLEPEAHGTAYRLIGIGVSQLCESLHADPADLVDRASTRRAAAEIAMDSVRHRFGKEVIGLGMLMGSAEKPDKPPDGAS